MSIASYREIKLNQDTSKKHLVVTYHPNGKIKEKGYQGYYADQQISTGAFVGMWYRYNLQGQLIQSTYYHNNIFNKAFIEVKKYHFNGKVKSIERFNNYELYETDAKAIGQWKYFDKNGKLIKAIQY